MEENQIVQYLVPTSYGRRMINIDTAIVPRRGESVYVELEERDESGTFVVTDIEYTVREEEKRVVANVHMERKDVN